MDGVRTNTTPRERISGIDYDLMIGTAIFFDILNLIELIPVIGWIFGLIIDLLGYSLFGLWFASKSISIWEAKKARTFIISAVVSAIPEVGAFIPDYTFMVWRVTKIVREEDAEYNNSMISSGNVSSRYSRNRNQATPKKQNVARGSAIPKGKSVQKINTTKTRSLPIK
ncbi:MAG: hypothetical protein WCW87_00505 [Candidatus Paceibacterota bacterium]